MGDEVLKNVATWIRSTVRATDFAARYGGEEFVVILPNTNLNDLRSAAERIRQTVEQGCVEHKGVSVSVTISIGGACVRTISSLDDGQPLIELADKCLYEAKGNGRNRCVCQAVEAITNLANA